MNKSNYGRILRTRKCSMEEMGVHNLLRPQRGGSKPLKLDRVVKSCNVVVRQHREVKITII